MKNRRYNKISKKETIDGTAIGKTIDTIEQTHSAASCNCLGEMLSRLLRFFPLTNFAPTWRAAKKRGRRINNLQLVHRGVGKGGSKLHFVYHCKLQHMPHTTKTVRKEEEKPNTQRRSKQEKNKSKNNNIFIIIWGIPLLCPVCHSHNNDNNNKNNNNMRRWEEGHQKEIRKHKNQIK